MWFGISLVLFALAIISYKMSHPKKKNDNETDGYNMKTMSYETSSTTSSLAATNPAPRQETPKPAYTFFDETLGMKLAYQYHDVDVAMFQNSEIPAAELKPGMLVLLIQEPTNEYDNKAVKVQDGGKKLGYLYKGKIQDMVNDWITKGLDIWSYVSNVDLVNNKIQIAIAFYKEGAMKSLMSSGAKYKKYRLTGNRNDDMQTNIGLCDVGQEVTLDYDYEKEKYLVTADDDIGYLPVSANEIAENHSQAFVESIDVDDNGNNTISIVIFMN